MVFEPVDQTAVLKVIDYLAEQAGEDITGEWFASMFEAVDALETLPEVFPVWTFRKGFVIYPKPV